MIFILVMSIGFARPIFAQSDSIIDPFDVNDRRGLLLGFGVGTGFSKHAASYTVIDPIAGDEKLSGYRIITLIVEPGYGVTPHTLIKYSLKYSPPNTTISPYQSTYHGITLNRSPKGWNKGLILLSAGYQKVSDKKGKLSEGLLIEAGLGYEISPHFIFQFSNSLGPMKNFITDPSDARSLDSSFELMISFSVNYIIY